MIGRLTGRVTEDDGHGALVVDVNGVGYELFVALGASGRARVDETGRALFFIHTHVREDILALYGFPSQADRAAFRALLGVSNVGPRTALAVLSELPASELARVVARKDLKALTAVTGIGKKTAEMMLVQLRDKLDPILALDPAQPGATPGSATGGAEAGAGSSSASLSRNAEILKSALTGLGYRAADADRAVAALGDRDRIEAVAPPDLLREALAVLAK